MKSKDKIFIEKNRGYWSSFCGVAAGVMEGAEKFQGVTMSGSYTRLANLGL